MAVAPAPARPRPGGGRLFIIVGLLLAILAGAGVFFLGGTIGGGGGIGGAPTTTVVVAKQPIAMRHAITASDLETSKVSGSFTSVNNVYANPSDVVNLIAQVQITKGSVITSDMLAKDVGLVSGAAPAYLPLASGYVAMTIPTGEQQGVAGHITLGDYITVVSSASVSVFASPTSWIESAAVAQCHQVAALDGMIHIGLSRCDLTLLVRDADRSGPFPRLA